MVVWLGLRKQDNEGTIVLYYFPLCADSQSTLKTSSLHKLTQYITKQKILTHISKQDI